jgi:diguanylate cyclase (GGDEF)-like protein
MSGLSQLQTVLLAAAVVLLPLVGGTAGFFLGVWSAPWWRRRALQQAAQQFDALFDLTVRELEAAVEPCRQLAVTAARKVDTGLIERFQAIRQSLVEAMTAVSRQQKPGNDVEEEVEPPPQPLNWERTPADPATDLPNDTSFSRNLTTLIASGATGGLPAGLLLVQTDKTEQWDRRLGADQTEQLLQRMASLLVRGSREADLVCRLDRETFGVLLPNLSPLESMRQAEVLRTSIRNHRFLAPATGAEVLLTASLGLAAIHPTDNPGLAIDRARAALRRSQGAGRNQLHVDDGYAQGIVRLN